MPKPLRQPIRHKASKTDLRPPGQKLVEGDRLIAPQDLFHIDAADLPHPANQRVKIQLVEQKPGKKSKVVLKPKPSAGDGNFNPKMTAGIFDRATGTVGKKARELIMRIGRPRQP